MEPSGPVQACNGTALPCYTNKALLLLPAFRRNFQLSPKFYNTPFRKNVHYYFPK